MEPAATDTTIIFDVLGGEREGDGVV